MNKKIKQIYIFFSFQLNHNRNKHLLSSAKKYNKLCSSRLTVWQTYFSPVGCYRLQNTHSQHQMLNDQFFVLPISDNFNLSCPENNLQFQDIHVSKFQLSGCKMACLHSDRRTLQKTNTLISHSSVCPQYLIEYQSNRKTAVSAPGICLRACQKSTQVVKQQ